MEHDNVLSEAVGIAREAGEIVRRAFPRGPYARVEFKGEVNPVTEIDLAAEALIRGKLRATFPGHRILAEEGGGDAWQEPGPPIWVVDPLDGTNNFAHGFPHVGISLALLVDGEPVVGVVHDPLRGETFGAVAGSGARLNGEPVHVSTVARLTDGFLATGFPYDRRTAPDNNTARLGRFLRRSQGVRRAGAATLDLAYVSCGRFDGFWEIRLKPWDVAAGVLLVREAGGQVTDFAGTPDCLSGADIVASNGRIHGEMLRVIWENTAANPAPRAS